MLLKASLHSKRSYLLSVQPLKSRISSKIRFNSTFVDSGNETHNFDYDLIVIGGGSGGLACSKEAADLGKKVAVVDFVKPSPHSTTWGLGGTCVNVGCIPKKLMHQASLLGKSIEDAQSFGWSVPDRPSHDWNTMVSNVQNYIRSLNWGYRVQLRNKEINYINALASFIDPHSIQCVDKKGVQKIHTARRFVIAVGGRPKYLDIPGSELAITSDDVFSLRNPPGKTLVIGAGYIALETAGFLSGLGYSTTVMARSRFLRSFDQQMSEKVVEYMELHGTNFVRGGTPQKIEKNENGKLTVTYDINGEIKQDEFDTVMYAVGRIAETKSLALSNANVDFDSKDGKIITQHEQTSSPHIYAIGDTIKGPELTPVAIRAGKLLARRLYRGSQELMDYHTVPTTVFTPLEYASCGMSEDDANRTYGEENIEVYHANIQPLEWTVPHREENACYVKIMCNKLDSERVVGIHVLAPNAGEIMQGFAVAMRLGVTKASLEQTVGIHPTIAEELTLLRITKRSGEDPKKTGC